MKQVYVYVGRQLFRLMLPAIRTVLRGTERSYVCVRSGGEVLLIKNWLARDSWRMPGGGKGKAESFAGAAIRELREELGIHSVASQLHVLGSFVAQTDSLGFRYQLFLLDLPKKPQLLIDRYEITDVVWVTSMPDNATTELKIAFKAMRDL